MSDQTTWPLGPLASSYFHALAEEPSEVPAGMELDQVNGTLTFVVAEGEAKAYGLPPGKRIVVDLTGEPGQPCEAWEAPDA